MSRYFSLWIAILCVKHIHNMAFLKVQVNLDILFVDRDAQPLILSPMWHAYLLKVDNYLLQDLFLGMPSGFSHQMGLWADSLIWAFNYMGGDQVGFEFQICGFNDLTFFLGNLIPLEKYMNVGFLDRNLIRLEGLISCLRYLYGSILVAFVPCCLCILLKWIMSLVAFLLSS